MWRIATRPRHARVFVRIVVLPDESVQVDIIPDTVDGIYRRQLLVRKAIAQPICKMGIAPPEDTREAKEVYVRVHANATDMSVVMLVPKTLEQLQQERAAFIEPSSATPPSSWPPPS
jgi:hypothetical protein